MPPFGFRVPQQNASVHVDPVVIWGMSADTFRDRAFSCCSLQKHYRFDAPGTVC
jgi:hypothetical protein